MRVPDPAVSRPVKPRCDVCGHRVSTGRERCPSCRNQLPLFSGRVDRRRREWRP